MQVGSASTAGRRSSVQTQTVARVRPSDSLPPLGSQRSLTTGSISTPHGGAYATTAGRTALAAQETTSRAASYTLRTTPVQGHQGLGRDASLCSLSERTCGEMGHGTPDTSAERASCVSGTSRLMKLTNGWRFTTQGQRGRPATSGGHRTTHARHGTGNGATHHTAADGTTARAGGRRSTRICPRCTGPAHQGSLGQSLPVLLAHLTHTSLVDTHVARFGRRTCPSQNSKKTNGASDAVFSEN